LVLKGIVILLPNSPSMPTRPNQPELSRAMRFVNQIIRIIKKYDCGYGSKQFINRKTGRTYNHIYKVLDEKPKKKGHLFETVFDIVFGYGKCDERPIIKDFEKNQKARNAAWMKAKEKRKRRRGKKG
jgi:hypothetical protein